MDHQQSLYSPTGTVASNGNLSVPANWPLTFANLAIRLDSPVPIYQQVLTVVRAAIVAGELPPGTVFPTSRELAGVLGVARNTIVSAYVRLAAEGYVVSNKRRGTRVAAVPFGTTSSPRPAQATSAEPQVPAAKRIEIGFHAQRSLDKAMAPTAHSRPFSVHATDPLLSPRNLLARLLAEEFRRPPVEDLRTGVPQGTHRVQTALAAYLRQMRGVFCSPEQIIPTTGLETALDLTIRVMIDPGHSVHIEDPTIDSVRAAFSAAGAQLYPLQTEAGPHAMDTSRRPPPRLIFVSPSTSFPLGQQMPESQRLSILDQAAAANAVIFECDACGELSYTGQRLQAIQGHDPRGQVLYFGSLTEALGPHIRMGFLVVPTSLIDAFSAMGHRISFSPDQFILTAIARLIEENRYAMHLRSIRSAYSQRMRLVVQACHALMNNVTVVEPMGGLHIALKFDDTLNEAAICSAATMQGLAVAPLSRFYMHPTRESGLVLGFGALPNRAIEPAVRRLAGIIEQSNNGAPTLRAG